MIKQTTNNWHEANKDYLMASIDLVRGMLERRIHSRNDQAPNQEAAVGPVAEERERVRNSVPDGAALDLLERVFGLTSFERDLLLLCAGVELDTRMPDLCAACHGDPLRRTPTPALALAVLPSAHWNALTPDGPLRYWRLLEVGPGDCLTTSPLRIDERILHFLTGAQHLDERLSVISDPVEETARLAPSHQELADRIRRIWLSTPSDRPVPVVQLCGPEASTVRAIAVRACSDAGLSLFRIASADVPGSASERHALARLWEREALLGSRVLLLEYDDTTEMDRVHHTRSFASQIRSVLLVSAREPIGMNGKTCMRIDVVTPSASEQRELWLDSLGPLSAGLNGQIARIVSSFRLSSTAIRAAGESLITAHAEGKEVTGTAANDSGQLLWDACRSQVRPRLDDLARRIPATAVWDDLVLPDQQRKTLKELASNVRQQAKVYEEWGFAARSPRGLGITALFHGPSGTGKTMAAEVLANELRLDLYHIDLSTVVSKYIGETEKHLRRIFDAAEQGGLILLFDEADALFGKRSEVKDSHDRYANIEVSYLLQRMEAYRGLAILTTNNKSALDPAFMRRIRFVVQFPFPDAGQRAEIWKRVFPRQTPVKDLDARKLARLNVAGGSIRNIALNAAFLAADQDRPVVMRDIRSAAQTEYAKIEKPITAAETRDWE